VRVPVLEYFIKDTYLKVRWSNTIDGFDMPVRVNIGGNITWLSPTTQWSEVSITEKNPSFTIDPNFYISSQNTLSYLNKVNNFVTQP
jgi:hypothetical protein